MRGAVSRKLACLAFSALAAAAAAAPPALPALRSGYAIDQPRILAQQHLFGLAHGIVLLAAACGPDTPAQEFAEWNEAQAATIEGSQRELARYHFGDRAAEATPQDIAAAIGLKDALPLAPGSKALADACASFGAALQKPRYDLRAQFRLQLLASRLAAAARIEAETTACRRLLAADERARLDDAVAAWHAQYDAAVEEARTAVEQHWPELQIEGSFEKWLAGAREDGRKAPSPERCATLPARLTTRTLDPDHAFDSAAGE